MKRIIVFCVLALAFAACNKDKVESTPHLKFKSFNKNPVADSVDQSLRVILEFTDKEADIDSFFITRQRLNQNGPAYFDIFYDHVPKFGNQMRGEIQLDLELVREVTFNLSPINIPGSVPRRNEPDTLLMRFYLKDKAGHTSDTAVAKQLIVYRS